MGVYGYVGLTGSGKTRRLTKALLEARAAGSEVWSNGRLGWRYDGWMVPLCGRSIHYARDHEAARYEFAASTPLLDACGLECGWRRGLGFIPSPGANLLWGGWDQLMALRVFRDELGRSHRCELVQNAIGEWSSQRACRVYDCSGCSKGLTVGIDELNQWAPAREWQKLGPGVLNRLAYVRKDGIDLHWTAQHERRIDTVPRELTESIMSCSSFGMGLRSDGRPWISLFGRGIRAQVFRREKWIPALMTDKNRVVTGEGAAGGGFKGGEIELVLKWGRQLLTREERAYDTYEHVQPAGEIAEQRERAERADAASSRIVMLSPERAQRSGARRSR